MQYAELVAYQPALIEPAWKSGSETVFLRRSKVIFEAMQEGYATYP